MVPNPTVSQQGLGVVPADLLNTFVQGGFLLADLRGFIGQSNMTAMMLGFAAPNDGGQGTFYWNPGTGFNDDGGVTCVVPPSAGAGAWIRQPIVFPPTPPVVFPNDIHANSIEVQSLTANAIDAQSVALNQLVVASTAINAADIGGVFIGGNAIDVQSIAINSEVVNSSTINSLNAFTADMGGVFFSAGTVVAPNAMSASAFNVVSDYRLKVVFGSFENTGDIIDAVPIYLGATKDAPQVRKPMLLAHELQEVCPFAVAGKKDAMDWLDPDQIMPQRVDYNSLVPLLWQEIKSLRRRVAMLERV
jgi:hypothetical protein